MDGSLWDVVVGCRLSVACAWCISVCLASACPADDGGHWSQWRGPIRDGQTQAAEWAGALNESSLKEAWRIKLQPSYSGPIVWGDRVFTTETVDKRFERVTALNRDTGELLWTQQWEGSMTVPFFAASNGSWIRSTPACDGELLFVAGMRDVLVALDVQTGEVRWQVDFVQQLEASLPAFGFVCSPLLDGDDLYVQAGGRVLKLEKRTGKIIWETLADGGGMYGSAFSSPVLADIRGERQLLVQTRTELAGVDPATGSVLWKQEVPAFRGMNILTPTVWQDLVFTSSYGGRTFMYRPESTAGAWSVATAWENKMQGYMSSPIVHEDHLYLHLRNGRLTCINLATGAERWTTTPFGRYWSMVKQGDRILALDESGELLMVRANPEKFELIDRRKVSEESTWAHLASDGRQLFVRELNGMVCFEWQGGVADDSN